MNACATRGGDIPQAFQLLDHGLWDHPAMDPNSCGVVSIFAPIGPWTHSEYSSPLPAAFLSPLRAYCSVSPIYELMHQLGSNHEEHQRLGMLGTLERQNFRVS